MQLESEKDLRINQLKLIVFVMFALFVVMLTYTIYWTSNYREECEKLVKISAEIIDQKEINGETRDVLCYMIDGVEYEITSDIESTNDIGDIITIYYDKENPLSFMFSDNRTITLPVITICFGVVCVALLVMYILIYRSNKKEKLKLISQKKEAENNSRTRKKTIAKNNSTIKRESVVKNVSTAKKNVSVENDTANKKNTAIKKNKVVKKKKSI